MVKYIYFNNQIYPEDTKLISVLDRGLCFGDGLFEVIRCIGGKFLLFSMHVERMRESSVRLKMIIPYNSDALLMAARELSQRNKVDNGELYLELTRGEAPRYHYFPQQICPNFFMTLNPLRKIPFNSWTEGVSVCTTRDLRGGLCSDKTINLLPNILGKEEAKQRGCYEALFYREDGKGEYLTEGPSSSYFGIREGILYTPALENILAGATREVVLTLAVNNSIKVVEKRISLAEYQSMDETFLTSTISEVMPVVSINNKELGNGAPGPLTIFLQERYAEFKATHLE